MSKADTDALVEAMAVAILRSLIGYDWDNTSPWWRKNYLQCARALLPIITAHTAAAVAAEREGCEREVECARSDAYDEGYRDAFDSAINQQENPND
jgi:hypothetical protein